MINVSIVTYKHEIGDIAKLVESIINSESVVKLFIIDNSPTSKLQTSFDFEKVEYVFTNGNIGYGAGHNIAIKKSIELGYKYHLVVNPDVVLNFDVLDTLIDFMDNNIDIGNIMPKVVYPNGALQYLCKLLPTPYDWIGRRFNPFKKLVEKRNLSFELKFTNYSKIMDVPYLSGCFMFLRVSAIRDIGLFDENIFMYGEETDLCRRLISSGYRTVFYPEVQITHEFQKGSHKSLRLTFIGIKSAIYYFNKWGWFFDKERKDINKRTLLQLGYKK